MATVSVYLLILTCMRLLHVGLTSDAREYKALRGEPRAPGLPKTLTIIDNGVIKVGIDSARGGTIFSQEQITTLSTTTTWVGRFSCPTRDRSGTSLRPPVTHATQHGDRETGRGTPSERGTWSVTEVWWSDSMRTTAVVPFTSSLGLSSGPATTSLATAPLKSGSALEQTGRLS